MLKLHSLLLYCILNLQYVFSRLSNKNPLNKLFKSIDYGSPGLIDTSSFIDPYRTDTSMFRPYLYGYVEPSTATIISTDTFEQCMEQCIQDSNCKAFEINMMILPFQCKLSVKPCDDGLCSEFKSNPYWKHFIRDDDSNKTISPSTTSLNSFGGKYKIKQLHKVNSFSVELELNNTLFEYIEIKVADALSDSIHIDYLWFEYQRTSISDWLKCQRIQLPQTATTYRIPNKCIEYEFESLYQSKCDDIKKSWEYHPITTQTKKIGNVFLENDLIPTGNTGVSLTTCNDQLVLNRARNAQIYYKKLGPVHAVRLFTTVGKFVIQKMEPISFKHTIAGITPLSIISKFGDTDFKHPPNSTIKSNDARNIVDKWYYDILKDGGYLWCRNPLNSQSFLGAQNVFKRMHHNCYYKGSTLSKTTKTYMSDTERIHYFTSDQCSFNINDIPKCYKVWVEIEESCQGWQYCKTCLNQATDITIYHKYSSTHSVLDGQSINLPVVSWKSGWNRAETSNSELNWSIDYMTKILLVLHDCLPQFDDMSGCSQCGSKYFEVEHDPSPAITVQNLRIYKYDINKQYCRPQSGIAENQCESQKFCPKGGTNTDFQDHNYWSCRTNFNGEQKIVTGLLNTMEQVNHGFGCFVQ